MKYFIIQGVIGALLSWILLTIFIVAMFKNIPELALLINFGNLVIIYISVLILGVVLTTVSTYLSMLKYLHADIDDLYE